MVIDPGRLEVGQSFSIGIELRESITKPFDFYLLAETPAGIFTIYFNGSVKKGIAPIVRNVRKMDAPYSATVRPAVKIPASMAGKTIIFYAVAVEAGKLPPVKKPSELTPSTPYVIMMDKASATIAP